MTAIAPTLQAWFTDGLITQRNVSPRTIIAYRDTLRLLLRYAHDTTGKEPSRLDFTDLDATLSAGANCRVIGKGRKERCAMLTTETIAVLRTWLEERQGRPDDPLFPTRQGGPLAPKAVTWLLDKHVVTAARSCRSLAEKRVTPHVLRHYLDG